MNFVLGVPIMNQQATTAEFLDNVKSSQSKEVPIIFVDNGSEPPLRDWIVGLTKGDVVIRNPENVGLLKALNQIYKVALDFGYDYIFYTHNDVFIYEKGWDEKVSRVIDEVNQSGKKVGVAGFYGAKGIGTPDIYRSPYVMQQMIRLENVSGCHRMDAAVHGFRPPRGEWEEVAVMDGFSLIVSVDLLNELGGFDRTFPPHHMYDNDICLESLDKGYRNIVISVDAQHAGGRTDVGEDWSKPFNKTKQQIHEEAHPIFYEKWHPKHVESGKHKISLPVRLLQYQ